MTMPDILNQTPEQFVASIIHQKVQLTARGYTLETGIPIHVCKPESIELQSNPDGMVSTLFDYEGPSREGVKAFEQRVTGALTGYFWVTDIYDRLTVTGEVRGANGDTTTRSIGVQEVVFNPSWPF